MNEEKKKQNRWKEKEKRNKKKIDAFLDPAVVTKIGADDSVGHHGVRRTGGVEEDGATDATRHRKQVVPATHRRLPAHAFRSSSAQTLSSRACRPIFKPRFTTGSAMNGRVNDSRFIHRGNCIEQPFLAIT